VTERIYTIELMSKDEIIDLQRDEIDEQILVHSDRKLLKTELEMLKKDSATNRKKIKKINALLQSNMILSMAILASRSIFKKHNKSTYLKKHFIDPVANDNVAMYSQDNTVISAAIANLATESLTWFGIVSGISSLKELHDVSNDAQHLINLLQKHIWHGVLLKEKKNLDRSYADSEIKRLKKILENGKPCFHMEPGSDLIVCKKCDEYEPRLKKLAKDLSTEKEGHIRESKLEQYLFHELDKVPKRRQNPNSKNRNAIYGAPELFSIVVKSCALAFPNLSFTLLRKIIYKILVIFDKSEPFKYEDINNTEGANMDYFESLYFEDIFDHEHKERWKKEMSVAEVQDYEVSELINKLTEEDEVCLATEMQLGKFKTNKYLAEYLGFSEEKARTVRKESLGKVKNLTAGLENDMKGIFTIALNHHLQGRYENEENYA
jgi:hypothetical protein